MFPLGKGVGKGFPALARGSLLVFENPLGISRIGGAWRFQYSLGPKSPLLYRSGDSGPRLYWNLHAPPILEIPSGFSKTSKDPQARAGNPLPTPCQAETSAFPEEYRCFHDACSFSFCARHVFTHFSLDSFDHHSTGNSAKPVLRGAGALVPTGAVLSCAWEGVGGPSRRPP